MMMEVFLSTRMTIALMDLRICVALIATLILAI